MSPPQLACDLGGSSSYFVLQTPLASWIRDVGDTLTVGARVMMTSTHAATKPWVGGFGSSGPTGALVVIIPHQDLTTTAYCELEVSKTNDPSNPYTYRGWVNGVLKFDTVRAELLQFAYLGSSTPWQGGAVSAGTIIIKDIYWAFNKDGVAERIGPCTVASVPRTVVAGSENPGGENITSARAFFTLTSGSKPPITLKTPIVQAANLMAELQDPNIKVLGLKMATIGKASVQGTAGIVTSQIIDHEEKVVGSNTKENLTTTYAGGVATTSVDVSNLTTEQISKFKFISSREKAPSAP